MKILFLDTVHITLKKGLEGLGYICTLDNTSSKSKIQRVLNSYGGIVIRSRFKIDKNFLNQCNTIKFIARVGAGLENIDIDYATKKGIACISAPEGNRDAVGEHTLGMLLSLFNNLNRANTQVKSGEWLREENRGNELAGKTIGIIGYGNMGKSFAHKLSGFSAEVLAYDIKPNCTDQFAKQVDLQTLFKKTQVLSIHTPLTNKTSKMFDEEFINKFDKPFYLLNTARGKIVDTKALVKGLKQKKILGACLDVLEYEKISSEELCSDNLPEEMNYLINSNNVLLTPHIAGWTKESNIKMAQIILEKIKQNFKP